MSGKAPTVAQLKELLAARGLPTTGLKKELEKRLQDAIAAEAAAEPAKQAEEPAPAAPAPAPAAPVQSPVRVVSYVCREGCSHCRHEAVCTDTGPFSCSRHFQSLLDHMYALYSQHAAEIDSRVVT